MIVDPDFLDHWRTGMVADALGDPMAALYILRLWAHCQTRKSDTFVMPARGLKAQCKYPGDADAFEAALVEAGYLARNGDSLTAIGWAEQNASLLSAWANGNKGGRPKKNPPETAGKPEGNPSVNPSETAGQPMGSPSETDKSREEKKEDTEEANASSRPRPKADDRPDCPYQSIIDLYHGKLPELPGVRVMDEKRKTCLRSFWTWVLTSKRSDGQRRAIGSDQALTWIGQYFERASANDFVMGRTGREGQHRNWRADIEYLCGERGRKQVIEKTEAA